MNPLAQPAPIDKPKDKIIPGRTIDDLAFRTLDTSIRFITSASKGGMNQTWKVIDSPEKAASMLALGALATVAAIECPLLLLIAGAPIVGGMIRDRAREFSTLWNTHSAEKWGNFVGEVAADVTQIAVGYRAVPGLKDLKIPRPQFPSPSNLARKLPELVPNATTPDHIHLPVPSQEPNIVLETRGQRPPSKKATAAPASPALTRNPVDSLLEIIQSRDVHSWTAETFASMIARFDLNEQSLIIFFTKLDSQYAHLIRTVIDTSQQLSEEPLSAGARTAIMKGVAKQFVDTFITAKKDNISAKASPLLDLLRSGFAVLVAEELLPRIVANPSLIRRSDPLLRAFIDFGGIGRTLQTQIKSLNTRAQLEFVASYLLRHSAELSAPDQLTIACQIVRKISEHSLVPVDDPTRLSVLTSKVIAQLPDSEIATLAAFAEKRQKPGEGLLIDGAWLTIDGRNFHALYGGLALASLRTNSPARALFNNIAGPAFTDSRVGYHTYWGTQEMFRQLFSLEYYATPRAGIRTKTMSATNEPDLWHGWNPDWVKVSMTELTRLYQSLDKWKHKRR